MIIAATHTPVKTTTTRRPFAEGIMPRLGQPTEYAPIPAKYQRPPVGTPLPYAPIPARYARQDGPSAEDNLWIAMNGLEPCPPVRTEDRRSVPIEGFRFAEDTPAQRVDDLMLIIGACG